MNEQTVEQRGMERLSRALFGGVEQQAGALIRILEADLYEALGRICVYEGHAGEYKAVIDGHETTIAALVSAIAKACSGAAFETVMRRRIERVLRE